MIPINLKRFKFYCCCQLLHVTAASVFAHACLLQDCNSPADAALQFEFCAAIFSFLDQTSLHVACVLRAVECKRVVVGMAVRIAAAPARVIVMCCAACSQSILRNIQQIRPLRHAHSVDIVLKGLV